MISGLVTSVVIAKSSFFESQVSDWELKLSSCSHTKNLDNSVSGVIATKSLAKCGDCDLSSNLWLCMTCGHLGCGRKQYDGSGGNNHGVDHGKDAHHPLVCKMGTITPEGTACKFELT
jgi:ubiquitin carboxyl-terminal hydrolase 5/13